MEALIQEKLHEIEKRENCRILLAVTAVAAAAYAVSAELGWQSRGR